MKLLILFISLFIAIDATRARSYLPTIPCIRVEHIDTNIPESVNKFLDKIGIDNFIDVKFTVSGWNPYSHRIDAFVIYKSLR